MAAAKPDDSVATVLVADEQDDVLKALRLLLKRAGMRVETAASPGDVLETLRRKNFDAVLMDLNYTRGCTDGREGLDLLAQIRQFEEDLPVIVMTAWGSINLAVEVMRRGASDFVLKPWENERLLTTLLTQIELGCALRSTRRLQEENRLLRCRGGLTFIAESPAMKSVLDVLNRTANSEANILITGENGTGKSILARVVHEMSARRDNPLVVVDVSSLSASVFESELFGHVKGAFTDAATDRLGRFECASGGTLFLDEIANLPMPLQSKLLRVIETGEFEPVGSSRTRRADVRLVSATNADIREAVSQGAFRADLLYRLNTVEIQMPALRERREDLLPLARHFLSRHGQHYRRREFTLHPDALEVLEQYVWPGNVRELDHTLERAVLMAGDDGVIRESDLGLKRCETLIRAERYTLEEVELGSIAEALARHNNNIKATAHSLGISRGALYRKMQKHGL